MPDALAALGDADGNESDGKLGFQGRLVAALDNTGRAKWIVILSDTNVETKGVDPTGSAVDIVVKCYANEDGVKDLFSQTTVKESTKNVSGGYWSITAPSAPAGYHLVGTSPKLVQYIKGQKTYEVEFNYVKNAPVPYTVSFDGNGSDGGTAPANLTEATAGAGVTLPAAGYTKTDYIFVGWGKAAGDTTATAGAAGAVYRPTTDGPVYAIWRLPQVSFDANGGTGTIDPMSPATAGGDVTAPDGTGFTRAGYTFSKWHTLAAGTGGTDYTAGANVPGTADLTLYAVWTANTVGGSVVSAGGAAYTITGTDATFTGKTGEAVLTVTLTNTSGAAWTDATVEISGLDGATLTSAATVNTADNGTETVTIKLPAQADITTAMATGQTITVTVTD